MVLVACRGVLEFVLFVKYYYENKMMKDLIGRPLSPHQRQLHADIRYDKLKEGDHCEHLEVGGRVVLKFILKKIIIVWTGFI
jgi:hypothetical protein